MKQKQDSLREKVRIAKALNTDWSYKNIAEYLNLHPNSFYNWLKGRYNLSRKKVDELEGILYTLLEY